MMSDWQLLREYAQKRSEAAFAELVKKHMNLVYGTCRRAVGDSQLAEDATQAVFLLLAQKAGSLGSSVSIPGWLFTAARLVSRNIARGEWRRHQYEEEAAQGMIPHSSPEPGRQEIEPWLNDAIAILTPGEREVILMRYFEDLSYQEIASEIGTVENTAGKRSRYAIDKMRRYLLKKGIVVSSASLAALLASDRAHAAPASCYTATLQTIRQLTAHAPAAHLALLYKGVYLTMQATKYKAIIVIAVALVLVGGTVAWHHARVSGSAVQWNAPLAADSASLAAERQVQAQLERFFQGYNTRNAAEAAAVLSPDCVSISPDQKTQPLQIRPSWFKDIDTAPDARLSATVTSFKVSGNTASVGADTLGYHDTATNEPSGGPIVHKSSHDVTVYTFVDTNGQWLMTRMDVQSETLDP